LLCRGIPGVQLLSGKFRRTWAYALYAYGNERVRRSAIPSWSLGDITPTSREKVSLITIIVDL